MEPYGGVRTRESGGQRQHPVEVNLGNGFPCPQMEANAPLRRVRATTVPYLQVLTAARHGQSPDCPMADRMAHAYPAMEALSMAHPTLAEPLSIQCLSG